MIDISFFSEIYHLFGKAMYEVMHRMHVGMQTDDWILWNWPSFFKSEIFGYQCQLELDL